HPAVAGGQAREAVPTAAHRDVEPRPARKANRGDDVGWLRAASDQRRMTVDRAVPDAPGELVARVLRTDQLAAKAARELGDGGGIDLVAGGCDVDDGFLPLGG